MIWTDRECAVVAGGRLSAGSATPADGDRVCIGGHEFIVELQECQSRCGARIPQE